MMGELLAVFQSSSILLPQCQLQFHDSPDRAYARFLRNRWELGSLSHAIFAQRHQKWVPRWTRTWVVSDSKAEIDIQADTSGRDGFGGAGDGGGRGGGGGGGGDDNNNSNEAGEGSGESDNIKKMAMSMSQKLTLGYAAMVGVGGAMGYLKSSSKKSLVAGGLSALMLYYVYAELPRRSAFASSLGFGLSVALLVVMGSRFKKSGKIFPAGVVSIVSLVMTGGYLHGILRSLH